MGNNRRFVNEPIPEFLVAAIKGITANMGKNDTVLIAGKSHTKAEILDVLAGLLEPYEEVEAARSEYEAKIEARDAAEPTAAAFARDYASGITSTYGRGQAVASRYGVPIPKARRELTPHEKVIKAAKAQETRKLRGTQGKKQRSKVKAQGNYAISVGTPPDAPARSVPPPPPSVAPASPGVNVLAATAAPNLVAPPAAPAVTPAGVGAPTVNGVAH